MDKGSREGPLVRAVLFTIFALIVIFAAGKCLLS